MHERVHLTMAEMLRTQQIIVEEKGTARRKFIGYYKQWHLQSGLRQAQ